MLNKTTNVTLTTGKCSKPTANDRMYLHVFINHEVESI